MKGGRVYRNGREGARLMDRPFGASGPTLVLPSVSILDSIRASIVRSGNAGRREHPDRDDHAAGFGRDSDGAVRGDRRRVSHTLRLDPTVLRLSVGDTVHVPKR